MTKLNNLNINNNKDNNNNFWETIRANLLVVSPG